MVECEFLFDNQLIAALEKLIRDAKHELLLISPFIDLDARIEDALKEKISKHDFKLRVVFGKNENNIYKSIKKNSIDFLMKFPNIEIRYNERLHAKFFKNDYDYIMTSLNLYDFSLANNIEVGIKVEHSSRGLIGKAVDGAGDLITQGTDKIKQEVFGKGKDIDPIEKFDTIFENSEKKYQTEPIISTKKGVGGLLGAKQLDGYNVVFDQLSLPTKTIDKEKNVNEIKSPIKTYSASQLAKMYNISKSEIDSLMRKSGLINDNKITAKGLSMGLEMKKYMGNDFIAIPSTLDEFRSLK